MFKKRKDLTFSQNLCRKGKAYNWQFLFLTSKVMHSYKIRTSKVKHEKNKNKQKQKTRLEIYNLWIMVRLVYQHQRNPSGQVTAASLLKNHLAPYFILPNSEGIFYTRHQVFSPKICLPVYSSLKCQQHCGFLHSCRHRKLMLRHLFL